MDWKHILPSLEINIFFVVLIFNKAVFAWGKVFGCACVLLAGVFFIKGSIERYYILKAERPELWAVFEERKARKLAEKEAKNNG